MGIIYHNFIVIKKKDECNEYIDNVGCTSCKFGYTLMYNTCIKNPEKCAIIKKDIGCVSCLPGYYLNNYECYWV